MKNLNWIPVLGLLAACTPDQGCSSWEEGSIAYVWIDDSSHSFSNEEIEIIHESCHEWEEATDNHVTFRFVSGKGTDSLIVVRSDSLSHIKEERGLAAVTDWVPWERGGAITMPNNVAPEQFRLLMLHELGHALGLDHDRKGTIMFPGTGNASDFITCEDVTQFCEVNDCQSDNMPPCMLE